MKKANLFGWPSFVYRIAKEFYKRKSSSYLFKDVFQISCRSEVDGFTVGG